MKLVFSASSKQWMYSHVLPHLSWYFHFSAIIFYFLLFLFLFQRQRDALLLRLLFSPTSTRQGDPKSPRPTERLFSNTVDPQGVRHPGATTTTTNRVSFQNNNNSLLFSHGACSTAVVHTHTNALSPLPITGGSASSLQRMPFLPSEGHSQGQGPCAFLTRWPTRSLRWSFMVCHLPCTVRRDRFVVPYWRMLHAPCAGCILLAHNGGVTLPLVHRAVLQCSYFQR